VFRLLLDRETGIHCDSPLSHAKSRRSLLRELACRLPSLESPAYKLLELCGQLPPHGLGAVSGKCSENCYVLNAALVREVLPNNRKLRSILVPPEPLANLRIARLHPSGHSEFKLYGD